MGVENLVPSNNMNYVPTLTYLNAFVLCKLNEHAARY